MILTFTKHEFKERIKSGEKIHTIRADVNNRWKVGRKINFWLGNPRNVENNPHEFGTGVCDAISTISIYPSENRVVIKGEHITSLERLNELAENDGFDNWEQMKEWFSEEFHGKMIYWSFFEPTENN